MNVIEIIDSKMENFKFKQKISVEHMSMTSSSFIAAMTPTGHISICIYEEKKKFNLGNWDSGFTWWPGHSL